MPGTTITSDECFLGSTVTEGRILGPLPSRELQHLPGSRDSDLARTSTSVTLDSNSQLRHTRSPGELGTDAQCLSLFPLNSDVIGLRANYSTPADSHQQPEFQSTDLNPPQ